MAGDIFSENVVVSIENVATDCGDFADFLKFDLCFEKSNAAGLTGCERERAEEEDEEDGAYNHTQQYKPAMKHTRNHLSQDTTHDATPTQENAKVG